MTIHVQISGHGPNLVLLHGWAMHSGVFRDIADLLSAQYRVHSMDLPGHGRSDCCEYMQDLQRAADGIAPHVPADAVAIGWSLGGLVALKLAQRHKLRGLVLVNTTPRFVANDSWPHGMEPKVFAQFFARLQQNIHATVDDFLQLQVRGDTHAAATLASLKKSLLLHPADPQALQLGLQILRDADERAALATINIPALVIAGEYDRITHPEACRFLSERLPRARYSLIKRAGHAAFISHREQFLDELHSFLSGINAVRKAAVDG
jgi:pimeloyl-[acyl-carrier protein] methyl ester esterase